MSFTAGLLAGHNDTTDLSVNEEVLRAYNSDDIGLYLKLEYPFSEEFSVAATGGYYQSKLRTENLQLMDISDLNSIGVSGEITWKDIYYDISYDRDLLARASYAWHWGLDGSENYSTVSGSIKWDVIPWWNHLLSVEAQGGWGSWGSIPIQKQFRLGGVSGSLILPTGKIAAEDYVSSAFLYNIPVWSFMGGTLSTKVFHEAGYYKSDLVNPTLFHGPGLGLDLFIENLGIPAVQLNLGWNMETGLFQFSAGIGLGGRS